MKMVSIYYFSIIAIFGSFQGENYYLIKISLVYNFLYLSMSTIVFSQFLSFLFVGSNNNSYFAFNFSKKTICKFLHKSESGEFFDRLFLICKSIVESIYIFLMLILYSILYFISFYISKYVFCEHINKIR